jgi:hypothetical protein
MGRPIDLVIIGQISKDIILIDGRAETAPGGGVLYASYAATATGAEILAVTKLAAEDAGLLSGFRERGIPVLDLPSPATTVMEDRFEAASGHRRRSRILSQATPFSLSEISVSRAGIYYLTALMHGEIPEAMIAELAGRGRVALDVQGFLRHREGELLSPPSSASGPAMAFRNPCGWPRRLPGGSSPTPDPTGVRHSLRAPEPAGSARCRSAGFSLDIP